MLDFYADWCVSCKEMERYTFTDRNVQAALDGVILLQADVTANDARGPGAVAALRHFRSADHRVLRPIRSGAASAIASSASCLRMILRRTSAGPCHPAHEPRHAPGYPRRRGSGDLRPGRLLRRRVLCARREPAPEPSRRSEEKPLVEMLPDFSLSKLDGDGASDYASGADDPC